MRTLPSSSLRPSIDINFLPFEAVSQYLSDARKRDRAAAVLAYRPLRDDVVADAGFALQLVVGKGRGARQVDQLFRDGNRGSVLHDARHQKLLGGTNRHTVDVPTAHQ